MLFLKMTMKTKIKMYKENTQIQDFILIFLKILFYLFREGKGERKRGKHQCVVVSHMPSNWGPGPQPRHVP